LKVAIIGAGVAGLACAHELERFGVYPTIYERKGFIGDIENHVTATMHIITRPIKDWLEYVKSKFNIDIVPLNTLNTVTHHSPNKTTVVKGNLGYFLKRSRDEDSLLGQLQSQLRHSEIILNEHADYTELSKTYDYVVIANGNSDYTNELGCWQERVSGWVRGAVVLGSFDPTELVMWINKDYSNKGYAYLTPFNGKKASLSLFVPYTSKQDIGQYWEEFRRSENLKYTIIEEFEVLHHSGFVYPHKLDNIYFAGISGGAVTPFLGFGQVESVLQGVFAAQSIVQGKDYEKLLKNSIDKTIDLWEIRKSFNHATNKDYDVLLTLIGIPGVKQLIYNTTLDGIKYGGKILRLKRKLTSNIHK